MLAGGEQLLALKRVYREAVGEAESPLQFFLSAEALEAYLQGRATVEVGYARRLLRVFVPAQKSVVDFEEFAEMIAEIWRRYLPGIDALQTTAGALAGDHWANAALVDAALLVWAPAASPALHRFLVAQMPLGAAEIVFSSQQLRDGYEHFDSLCDAVEAGLSATVSPFAEGAEAARAFGECLQSARLPLAVAKEPSRVRRAAELALRLFERFLTLDALATTPAVLFQRDAGFFRTLAAVVGLFRFPSNFEDYAIALERAGLAKEKLHLLFEAFGGLACARFETGLASPTEDAMVYLLALAE